MQSAQEQNGSYRPLVTLCILAYQQEHLIAPAIEGALAQDYSPLEIILSDDCSADATYAIIERYALEYRGPHTVRVNRNQRNLGIGAHFSHVMGMAGGEWIAMAAGDDISLPNRISSLIAHVPPNPEGVTALFSDSEGIDGSGQTLGIATDRLPRDDFGALDALRCLFTRMAPGAVAIWHRSLYDVFGPLDEGLQFEDTVMLLRALLLGRTLHVSVPLIQYRRHADNVSNMYLNKRLDSDRKRNVNQLAIFRNCLRDLETAKARLPERAAEVAACERETRRRIIKLQAYGDILSGRTATMLRGLARVALAGGNPVSASKLFLRVLRSEK